MKKAIIIIVSVVLFILLLLYIFVAMPIQKELEAVRSMKIEDVDLQKVSDGIYKGEYGYGSFIYKVEVIVKNHRIEKINILENRDTAHAKKAETVIDRVLEKQTPDVDASTGATTTSKALLKAIENALKTGIAGQ